MSLPPAPTVEAALGQGATRLSEVCGMTGLETAGALEELLALQRAGRVVREMGQECWFWYLAGGGAGA
jgi:predicted Rossmann fold nucleotide-binding protein DprA/Smf involved in DNA uptake